MRDPRRAATLRRIAASSARAYISALDGAPARIVLFWFAIAALTAAAVFAATMPLLRREADAGGEDARDRAVYRAQLAELERERAEGRIGEREADAARAEIARRIIASRHDDKAAAADGPPSRRRAAAALAAVGVPALALGIYASSGEPSLPGQPLEARLAAAGEDVAAAMRKIEDHLARNPEDGRGWQVVAPVYLRLGRPDDAARAWANALRLLGPDARREADLGEAIVAREAGIVTAEARAAFERALGLEPREAKAQFYLGLAAEQEGKAAEAAERWRALLADGPADAPWRGAVETALARVGGAPALAPGPSGADIAAAEALAPEEQQAMIEGMVARLAGRLEQQPDDAEGWLRLVQAYAVLGRPDEASAAADRALRSLSGEADRRRVETLVASLGLKREGEVPQ